MRIFYTLAGRIATTVKSDQLNNYDTTVLTNPNLFIDIDEFINLVLINDIIRLEGKTDINGLEKYYIQAGELYSRDGWIEFHI